MERTFINLKAFDKHWNELGLTDADLQVLQNIIMENPAIGDLIQGTGGLRKMRFALPNSGKSGGVRTLYVDYMSYNITVLMGVYSKSEQVSLTNAQKQGYKQEIDIIKRGLRK